jgi:hypothetical protein
MAHGFHSYVISNQIMYIFMIFPQNMKVPRTSPDSLANGPHGSA